MVRSFHLVAGAVALDLVNTLDNRFRSAGPPDELLPDYQRLLQFLCEAGLLSRRETKQLAIFTSSLPSAESVLQDVRRLRESVAAITYAWTLNRKAPDAALRTVEELWKQVEDKRTLSASQPGLRWTWPPLATDPASPLWLLLEDSLAFLSSPDVTRIRRCRCESCQWLFLDRSKNGTRRWCDMKLCGNRMKAQRYDRTHRVASRSGIQ